MRKKGLLAAFGIISFALGGVVVHAAAGTPEIDRANVTMQLSGTLNHRGCVGEDNTDYVTYTGKWTGGESQFVPDPTDYSLTGPMTVSSIRWTINSQTQRGVLTAAVTVTDAASLATVYTGTLTLVTQGSPTPGNTALARGWINAAVVEPDEGATPGDDHVIANVEFKITSSNANGQFGDGIASLGIPDFSVVTNVAPKALDGTC